MTESVCVVCEETFPNIKLYRCQSCSEKQDSSAAIEFHCEDCLISHIRKGHSIVDSKGNEPLTCSKHSFVCTEYCKTCDVPFCLKCVRNHSKHELQLMEEKASEVKAEVFELLTELEVKEKPLKLKQEANLDVCLKNQQLVQDLKELVKEECKKLEEKMLEKIEEKSKLNEDKSNDLEIVYSKLLELQKTTRELLSQSDPKLLQNVAATANDIHSFEPIYNDSIIKESNFFSCDFGDVREMFEKLWDEFEMLMETSADSESSGNRIFYLSGCYKTCIRRVESSLNEIKFSTVSVDINNGAQNMGDRICVERLACNTEITHVFPTSSSHGGWLNVILILLNDKTAKKYDVVKGYFEPCDYPKSANFLWPYVSTLDFCSLEWCHWDAKEKKVRFSHNVNLSFDSELCPEIKMSSSHPFMLCFFDHNCDITLVNLFRNVIEKMSKEVHQLESIDCISVLDWNSILVWTVATKSVTLLRTQNSSFMIEQRISWENKPEVFPIKRQNLSDRLLCPILKQTPENNSDDTYVFVVF